MKMVWRNLGATFVYLLCASAAYCQQSDFAESAGYDRPPGWFGLDCQTQEFAPVSQWSEEIRLVALESELAAMATPEEFGPMADCGPVCSQTCCAPIWAHRSGIVGELLVLRARNAEVAYAVPIDGAIVPPPNPPIQVGPVAVADPQNSAGFRIGGMWALDDCSSIAATYTRFESSSTDAVATTAPLVLRSLVFHPGTANAGSDFLGATADLDIRFNLVDVDYRAVWGAGDLWVVNYLVGARYAGLTQDFSAVYTGTGTTDTLITNVNFDGGGFRLGLDGMRFAACSGLLVYGKTSVSIVAGEFNSRYTQGSDVDPIIVDTAWEAGRVVTILDLELGIGWQSAGGAWRVTAGYLMSSWNNVLPTNQWIQNVQTNSFIATNENNFITFDGLTARLEYRW